ncbi:MAG: Asp23/Gls24 family envelope stress response protein [Acutalibacteraceae bacterium]
MIHYQTRFGAVTVSDEYFAKLIGNAVNSCYGVSSMVATGKQRLRRFFSKKEYIDTGIAVRGNIDQIDVDLHISVTFGVNINAIAQSIVHKVKYVVEDSTGISVNKVTVHVDGMKNDN